MYHKVCRNSSRQILIVYGRQKQKKQPVFSGNATDRNYFPPFRTNKCSRAGMPLPPKNDRNRRNSFLEYDDHPSPGKRDTPIKTAFPIQRFRSSSHRVGSDPEIRFPDSPKRSSGKAASIIPRRARPAASFFVRIIRNRKLSPGHGRRKFTVPISPANRCNRLHKNSRLFFSAPELVFFLR